MKRSSIELLMAYLIAMLFLTVGLSRYFGFARFQDTLSKSPLVKDYFLILSFLLPAAQIVLALLLLTSHFRRKALFGSLALMLLFTLYNIYLLTLAPYIPCSCAGILNMLSWQTHLFVNIGLTVCCLLGIYSPYISPNRKLHSKTLKHSR